MASARKLEMSLDDIIKANKNKTTNNAPTGLGTRKTTQMVGKRFNNRVSVAKGKASVRKPLRGGRNPIQKKTVPKRVGMAASRRGRPVGKAKRFGVAVGARSGATLKNKAVISAAKNLVNKLVKKALSKTTTNPSTGVNAFRGGKRRILSVRAAAARRRGAVRTIVLNKISARSRVITRQQRRARVVAMSLPQRQQQQPAVVVQRVVRGRGPVRFGSNTAAIVPQTSTIVPKRRFRINAVQQQPPPVLLLQQQQQRPQRVLPSSNSSSSSMSVRQHINALRRATVVQQLQAQFISQQQQQQQPTTVRQQFRGRRQQIQSSPGVVVQQQQRPPPFRRLRRQSAPNAQQQYVVVQQQPRGNRSARRSYGQQPMNSRRRQQQQLGDTLYEPPNFLQRIPTGGGGAY